MLYFTLGKRNVSAGGSGANMEPKTLLKQVYLREEKT